MSRIKQKQTHGGEAPIHNPAEGWAGFWCHLYPLRGLSESQAEQFTQRLSNYCLEYRLQMLGSQLRPFVEASDRDLECTDQMDLLAWLANDNAIVHIEISALCTYDPEPVNRSKIGKLVTLPSDDPALAATLALYQMHRLSAKQSVELLCLGIPCVQRA